jgi:hypothetical protein
MLFDIASQPDGFIAKIKLYPGRRAITLQTESQSPPSGTAVKLRQSHFGVKAQKKASRFGPNLAQPRSQRSLKADPEHHPGDLWGTQTPISLT